MKGFAVIRNVIGVPDRRGNIPTLKARFILEETEGSAKVGPSQEVQFRTIKVEGENEVVYQFFSAEEVAEFKAKAKEKGWNIEMAPTPEFVHELEAVVRTEFAFVGNQGAHRTIAKIAYTGLARRAGEKVAASKNFEAIRRFITQGEGQSRVRLFLKQEVLRYFPLRPHQHALVFVLDGKLKRAHAMVVLFGGLHYLVTLSEDYQGADVGQTYVYDAKTGEENTVFVGKVDNEFLMVRDILEGSTVWNDVRQSVDCLMHYISQATNVKIEPTAG